MQLQKRDLGSVSILSTYSYTGSRHADIGNLPSQEMRGYGRWDLRANWKSSSGKWSAGVFVQNVLDDIGLVEYIPLSTNGNHPALGTLSEQRRLGLVLRWKM